MISLNVPFLPKTEIIAKANTFLQEHNLISIPINIEFVAEYCLGIDIIPFSNLKLLYGIDGHSAHNGSTIYVDEYAYKETPNRLRFTVAHELGHIILHRQYLRQVNWSSVEEWICVLEQLDSKDIEWMEYQATVFAGLVLVPQESLKILFDKELQTFKPQIQEARNNKLNEADYIEHLTYAIADRLSRYYEVSIEVITKRIEFDSLKQNITLLT